MKIYFINLSMNKIHMVSFFCIFLFGCNKQNSEKFDEKLIEKISNENTILPSTMNSISFYGQCSDDRIAEVHIQDLRGLYKSKWKNLNYREFLEQALNQKINIEYQDKIECFDLDNDVTSFYKNNDFNTFLNSYTEKSSNGLVLKSKIEENQINTILYYFFLHNYLASYDDYIGKYYIKMTNSFYEKQG